MSGRQLDIPALDCLGKRVIWFLGFQLISLFLLAKLHGYWTPKFCVALL